MPCQEWFDAQPESYRNEVLPPEVKARVSVEAGIAQGWQKYVGDKGRSVSIEHYGASGKGTLLFTEFGLTSDAVVAAAKESLRRKYLSAEETNERWGRPWGGPTSHYRRRTVEASELCTAHDRYRAGRRDPRRR